ASLSPVGNGWARDGSPRTPPVRFAGSFFPPPTSNVRFASGFPQADADFFSGRSAGSVQLPVKCYNPPDLQSKLVNSPRQHDIIQCRDPAAPRLERGRPGSA